MHPRAAVAAAATAAHAAAAWQSMCLDRSMFEASAMTASGETPFEQMTVAQLKEELELHRLLLERTDAHVPEFSRWVVMVLTMCSPV